jgi:peptidase E
MLAIWRQHGVDAILREAWERGIVLCGSSAGANCWFEACSTDSFGPGLTALKDGLGFLPGSFCPHYDGGVTAVPPWKRFITSGDLPSGYAVDNYTAIRWTGGEALGGRLRQTYGAGVPSGHFGLRRIRQQEIVPRVLP